MTIRIITGDCRDVLRTLPDASVQCCVTSPPYYGLRAYLPDGHEDKCREIGLEATPDEFVATLVEVFREVRRVLRPDGTLWLNLGDSYAGSWGNQGRKQERGTQRPINGPMLQVVDDERYPSSGSNTGKCPPGVKAKDLLMMPARVALALQADGYWLRSEIVWAKPNPMPESVSDRPTSAHEKVYLLAKSARYFYDADAVREPHETADRAGDRRSYIGSASSMNGSEHLRMTGSFAGLPLNPAGRNIRNVWTIATAPLSSAFVGGSYRIASQDCSVHDRRADLAHVLECDARQDVYEFGRNPGRRSRPAELPEGAVVSIPVNRSWFPSDVSSAIARSTQSHRTPVLSERDVIFGDISGGHTGCMVFLDHCFATSARILGSNTSQDASSDAPLICQSVQNPDRIVGIATFEPRPAGCSCYYAGTVHQRQDHFASFPPELAERCIRAGTSERGCCAKCGAPWVRVTSNPVVTGRRDPGGEYGLADIGMYAGRAGSSERTTTGWAPSCGCRELRCTKCSFVLATKYGKEASTKHRVSDVRDNVQTVEERADMLQSDVPQSVAKDVARPDVRAVRQSVSPAVEQNPDVQFGLFAEVDRTQSQNNQRLDDHQQGLQTASKTGPSERNGRRLRDGASPGDGEEAWPASDEGRGGSPQERQQAGQSDQQPGTDGEASTRRASQADLSCDLPELSACVPDTRTCPHCGSHAEWTTPATVPAVVLDIFAGAGTTLLVADRLQRDAVGIELNQAYASMTRNRIQDDAGMFAAVAD